MSHRDHRSDGKGKRSMQSSDRGLAEPAWPREGANGRAAGLPAVGHRLQGSDIVDYAALFGEMDGNGEGSGIVGTWHPPAEAPGRDLPAFRKLSVLMPIFNERWTLAQIVSRVLASPVGLEIELVAVDDGST